MKCQPRVRLTLLNCCFKWTTWADLIKCMFSGQIIATSHDLTPNGGLVREFPLFQGNLGWWNIIIWPECFCSSAKKKSLQQISGNFLVPVSDPWDDTRYFFLATFTIKKINEMYLDLPVWVPNGSVTGCQFAIPEGITGTPWKVLIGIYIYILYMDPMGMSDFEPGTPTLSCRTYSICLASVAEFATRTVMQDLVTEMRFANQVDMSNEKTLYA